MEKKYQTKEGKTIWVILIFLTVINLFMFNERVLFLPYIAFVIFVCAMFLSYEFKINEKTLSYQINLFGLALIKKEASASEIKEMYFVRLRDVPTVLIKPHKGMRWKLTKFTPSTYDQDLYDFATEHHIKCTKLNGYEPGMTEQSR
ncbi:hypothetical protein [Alkalihalobacterium alkalinitrilicum]|uniref:hypothetical protein n=1 Tax=Alkalihalobacterium alkalinitrilicum TaxID=427920 RepID=UPI00099589B5|nr:hypothetical protein [Alkalihalobacterium alkalinitrilicum]